MNPLFALMLDKTMLIPLVERHTASLDKRHIVPIHNQKGLEDR
jgi:hypothetical protein